MSAGDQLAADRRLTPPVPRTNSPAERDYRWSGQPSRCESSGGFRERPMECHSFYIRPTSDLLNDRGMRPWAEADGPIPSTFDRHELGAMMSCSIQSH